MAKLKIKLRGNSPGNDRYVNEVNAENFKELAIVLKDLQNLNLPISKAIKEFNRPNNAWDEALGF